MMKMSKYAHLFFVLNFQQTIKPNAFYLFVKFIDLFICVFTISSKRFIGKKELIVINSNMTI